MGPTGQAVRGRDWFILITIVSAVLLLGSTVTVATQVRPVNLEEMTAFAEKIFSGTCVEATVAIDPQLGLPVTRVTFAVDRAIKGAVGEEITIRLVGNRTRSAEQNQEAAGMPLFVPGEPVVLFLYAESELGLTSPVGLGQGKFTVYTDKHGDRIALNTLRNKNLLEGLSLEAEERLARAAVDRDARGHLSVTNLLELVETLAPLSANWEVGR
jgi:hypothetical protein